MEYKKVGVDLLVVSPGPTKTAAVDNAVGIDFGKLPVPMLVPEKVARTALKNLGRRGHSVVGVPNKIMDLMGKFLMPRPVSKRMYGWLLFRALDEDNRGITQHTRKAPDTGVGGRPAIGPRARPDHVALVACRGRG